MNRSFFQAAGVLMLTTAVALFLAGCVRDLPLMRQEFAGFTLYAAEGDSVETEKAVADSLASIAARLQVPVPSNGLAVYLLPSRSSLKRYLKKHCPEQASKAAACFYTPAGYVIALAPATVDGDVSDHLRHELTHYLLASHYFDFPPWIDEGLAQYFEREDPGSFLESSEFRQLKRDGLGISGEVIEELVAVPSGGELTRKQYRRTGMLVLFLMGDDTHGMKDVTCYLRQVRSDGRQLLHLRECFRGSPAELAARARSWFSRPGKATSPAPSSRGG